MFKLPLAAGTSASEVDANGVPAILCTRAGGDAAAAEARAAAAK
jgi:hypothetical protein